MVDSGMKVLRIGKQPALFWGVVYLTLPLLALVGFLVGEIAKAGHFQTSVAGVGENAFLYLPVIKVGFPLRMEGLVLDAEGPVPDAVVRLQTTENAVTSDNNGQFRLHGLESTDPMTLTA